MEKFLYNRINKNPKINVWFAFPAIESFALSSLGYMSIYKELDLNENIFVERISTDKKTTILKSNEVDVLGFSTSFEIDILEIMNTLNKYSIPLNSKNRDETHPIVFGGGPVLTSNPLPYQEFYDFICIGDAKEGFRELFDILVEKRECPRDEILSAINKLEYIWVPKFGTKKKIKKATACIDTPCFTPILSDKSFFKDTFILEIERGCPNACKFCIASWLNFPVRYVETKKIIDAIDFGLSHTDKIALLGAYVAGHPDFDKILEHIREKSKEKNISLSLSSLRADLTSENVVRTLVECGQKTATIAIEAGSERLRRVINKNLTEEQIQKTIKISKENGLSGLKIYVMIGHPTETDEDVREIVELAKRLKAQNKGFDLTYSLATFVPKAHTPFERERREDSKSLEKKIQYLKKELHKIGVKLRPTSVHWDDVQAIFSRYPDSLFNYFEEVNKRGANLGAFKHIWREFEKRGELPDYEETVCMPINPGKESPWNFIETMNK